MGSFKGITVLMVGHSGWLPGSYYGVSKVLWMALLCCLLERSEWLLGCYCAVAKALLCCC